jgi:glycosyltransferase involved in cell wall biosynthesis
VIVDGLSAKEGGGITDLLHLLPALLRVCPNFRLATILSSTYQQDLIDRLSPEVDVLPVAAPELRARRLRFLTRQVPQLVRSQRANAMLSMGEIASWNAPCPKLVLVRNLNLFAAWGDFGDVGSEIRRAAYRFVSRPFVKKTLDSADHLVFVSRASLEHVSALYPRISQKSTVVHLGIDDEFCRVPQELNSAVESPFILAVSTISPHKNYGVLIRAFARLLERQREYRDLKLIIAGSRRMRATHSNLVRLTNKLGIASRVNFLGHIPHSEVSALYRAAAVFVQPSKLESFGHPLLEAMACRTPIIASDIPASREVCGDVALYFPPAEVDTLQQRMHQVLQDPSQRALMSDRGARRAQDFSWSRTAAGIGRVISDFVSACDPNDAAGPLKGSLDR